MPSIRDVLEAPRPAETSAPKAPTPGPENVTQEAPAPESPAATMDSTNTPEATEKAPEDFETCWRTMFEEIFSSNPMIYHPLKDKIPALEDGVLKVEVLNDFQKEQYEMRKRSVLEYWRNHFSIDVVDLEILVNEQLEMKKIIYSADDKLRNLEEQNPEIRAFLQELNFRVKD